MSGKTIPAMDRYGATGLFQYRQFLDARFAAGWYTVVYRYTLGSFMAVEIDTFEIVAGGNVGGTPIGMYFFHKPEADYLIQDLDSGRLVQGRNPAF